MSSSRAAPRQRRPEGVGGAEVEGRRAVLELLRAGTRDVRSVSMSEGVERDDLVDAIVAAAGSKLRMVSPERLRAIAQTDAPQGVVARAEPLRAADLDSLLAEPRAFLVVLDGVTDPRNLGAIVRAVAAFGGHGVLIPQRRSASVTAVAWRTSAGAAARVPVARATNLNRTLKHWADAGLLVVGLDADGDTTIDEIDAEGPVVVVVGSEGKGLSRLVRENCDAVVSIPMAGPTESLNASVAAGVVLAEIARKRRG